MKRTVKIENVGIVGPLFASGSIWWVSGRKGLLFVVLERGRLLGGADAFLFFLYMRLSHNSL